MNGNLDERAVEFLPEALDPEGRPWRVYEEDAPKSRVDLGRAEAFIPRARTRAQEQIRLHEMAHVAHSDKCSHDTEMGGMICRMVEEVRVDSILYKDNGVDVRNRHDDFDWEDLLRQLDKTPFARAMAFLQTWFHTTKHDVHPGVKTFNEAVFSVLGADCQRLISEVARDTFSDRSIETREANVKKLLKFFAPPPPPEPKQPTVTRPEVIQEIRKQMREEDQEEREKILAEKAKDKPKGPEKKLEALTDEQVAEREKGLEEKPDHGGVPRFGAAEIHDHVLRNAKVENVKAPFTRTGRGICPEFMEHWLVDKRVYRTDHRGGTIVLDCSGSMRPNFDLITRQMLDFPNLVVTSYRGVTSKRGGISRNPTTGMRKQEINGRICVHARNGRIDPYFLDEPGTTGGNDVDIEALEYGAKFKGPHVWVSDGYACGGAYDDGRSGDYDGNIQIKVREVMKRYHYVRVNTLEDALAWVTRSRPVLYYLAGLLDPDNPDRDARRNRRP